MNSADIVLAARVLFSFLIFAILGCAHCNFVYHCGTFQITVAPVVVAASEEASQAPTTGVEGKISTAQTDDEASEQQNLASDDQTSTFKQRLSMFQRAASTTSNHPSSMVSPSGSSQKIPPKGISFASPPQQSSSSAEAPADAVMPPEEVAGGRRPSLIKERSQAFSKSTVPTTPDALLLQKAAQAQQLALEKQQKEEQLRRAKENIELQEKQRQEYLIAEAMKQEKLKREYELEQEQLRKQKEEERLAVERQQAAERERQFQQEKMEREYDVLRRQSVVQKKMQSEQEAALEHQRRTQDKQLVGESTKAFELRLLRERMGYEHNLRVQRMREQGLKQEEIDEACRRNAELIEQLAADQSWNMPPHRRLSAGTATSEISDVATATSRNSSPTGNPDSSLTGFSNEKLMREALQSKSEDNAYEEVWYES